MKVVIAGGGSVGRFTAEQLVESGHEVTIIESDRAVVREYGQTSITTGVKLHCGGIEVLIMLYLWLARFPTVLLQPVQLCHP